MLASSARSEPRGKRNKQAERLSRYSTGRTGRETPAESHGLPELRRQSWEFKQAPVARIHGAESLREESCRARRKLRSETTLKIWPWLTTNERVHVKNLPGKITNEKSRLSNPGGSPRARSGSRSHQPRWGKCPNTQGTERVLRKCCFSNGKKLARG